MRSRPVVVTPLSVRNPIGTYNATSGNFMPSGSSIFPTFTNTSTTTFAQQQTSAELNGKPIIHHNIKYTKLASPENFNEISKNLNQQQNSPENKIIDQSQQQKAAKGIPGRVISKSNMVITPEGILLKEEIIGLQVPKKEKPKVPPKPKTVERISPKKNSEKLEIQELIKPNPLDKNSNSIKEIQNDLLAPLNSILDDVRQLSQVSSDIKPQQVQVSIQSEDQPQVKKLHMFGQIPYTLTMRNIEKINPNDSGNENFQALRNTRKPFDLVSFYKLYLKDVNIIKIT